MENKKNKDKRLLPNFIRELKSRAGWIYWFSVGFDFWFAYMFFYHLGFRYSNEQLPFYFFMVIYLIFSALIRAFVLKPMATTVVDVFKDKLRIVNNRSEYLVSFDNIQQVKLRSWGCWIFVITKSGEKFIFAPILERPEYVVKAIYNYNKNLITESALNKYVKVMINFDHFQARLDSFFRKEKNYIGYAIIPPLAILSIFSYYSLKNPIPEGFSEMSPIFQVNSWICFGLLLSTIISYIWAEVLICCRPIENLEDGDLSDLNSNEVFSESQSLKQKNSSDNMLLGGELVRKRRDMNYEKKVYNLIFPYYLGAISFVFFLFTALNINP